MSEVVTKPLEEKENGKTIYLKHCEIVTDVDKLNVDLQATFMKYDTIKQWAYIVHDRDDTRAHYHIYLNFSGQAVDMRLISKWFNIPFNFINRIKGSKTDMLLYLIHGNESQKFKYQYSPEEVRANFDWQVEVKQSQIIGDFEHYSYSQMIKFVESIKDAKERSKLSTLLSNLWKQHLNYLSLNTDRNMQVVFVTGKAGSGKTYYARKLCDSENLDYCISSASNDPFNDYKGQRAFIFDDLRSSTYKDNLEEFLKLLDNNTCSSAKSRFCNVVLCCKLLIITSSVPLTYWFPEYKVYGHDSLQQLYRRIGNYVEITEKEIKVYSDIDEQGKPCGRYKLFKNELEKKKQEEVEKIDILSAFDKMCERIEQTTDYKQTINLVEVEDDGELPF